MSSGGALGTLRFLKSKMKAKAMFPRQRSSVSRVKFTIDGNIASGKSTFIKMLEAERPDWRVEPEPVYRWTNICDDDTVQSAIHQDIGGNLLKLFYDDSCRWSYAFQSYVFLSRLQLQNVDLLKTFHRNGTLVHLFERSLLSDRYIFASNCFENDLMSRIEWNLYQEWTTYLLESRKEPGLSGIIYMRVEPEVCLSRLRKRSRAEEKGVSLEYLRSLHRKHESLFSVTSNYLRAAIGGSVPVLTLDCNEEFAENPTKAQELMEEVVRFVNRETSALCRMPGSV